MRIVRIITGLAGGLLATAATAQDTQAPDIQILEVKPQDTQAPDVQILEVKPQDTQAPDVQILEVKPQDTQAPDVQILEVNPQDTQAPDVQILEVNPGDVEAAPFDAAAALQERVLGNPDAKVEIVSYESLTCPHCASFHARTFGALKERYIDPGHVKFVYRDFPLDGVALRGSMLARCAPPERFFGMIEVLFQSQRHWSSAPDPTGALGQIGRLGGVSDATFKSCMASQDLENGILRMRQAGSRNGVNSTPTFFVNGKKLAGDRSIEAFAKLIDPLLDRP